MVVLGEETVFLPTLTHAPLLSLIDLMLLPLRPIREPQCCWEITQRMVVVEVGVVVGVVVVVEAVVVEAVGDELEEEKVVVVVVKVVVVVVVVVVAVE